MLKILIVEDDNNTRKLISAILKNNGYDTLTATDGLDALSVMESNYIDLIVLDIMMPNMDGYDFTKHLRDTGDTTPILMVSAKYEALDKHKGFLVGTDDYITKPFDEEEMVLRVKALLRRSKIATEKKIELGSTIIDYRSLTVTRNNKAITLPQKEFLLLFKLLSYPGVIFTKLQLMDEIWGMDTESDDHTVNVHVNRLRKKMEDNPDFIISTVRGLGYKVEKLS